MKFITANYSERENDMPERPDLKKQKFHKYDHVKIDKDLGPTMSHFASNVEAIVMGSYEDQFGGGNTESYTLFIKGCGEVSWYKERQLTLIEKNAKKLYREWRTEQKKKIEQLSNLDWIFQNGKEVAEICPGPTVVALGKNLGINEMWGPRGEGYVYFKNATTVLDMADPFLKTGDKDGWLDFCKNK